ncbi:MAG: MotA/TolQ/ExbB proton channel family protein [Spirochaetes bacterium]|nr:MotA/TolQ/ExbB proton channel family protein [Spirochaetota bacterium]
MDILTNNIIVKGGWVMAPIILGSIIALALSIERGALLWKIRLDVKAFAERIFSLMKRGSRDAALDACSGTQHPIGRVFETGIEHWGEEPVEVEIMMEHAGNDEVARLEKRMGILLIIVGVEPMLGFFGTILGLIRAFMAWEQAADSVTVEQLASGIYQAMITTASGLLVAITFYIVYNLYMNRINNVAREMNHYGEELVGLMKVTHSRKKK